MVTDAGAHHGWRATLGGAIRRIAAYQRRVHSTQSWIFQPTTCVNFAANREFYGNASLLAGSHVGADTTIMGCSDTHSRKAPSSPFIQVHESIITCERCPRLRTYCKGIGETKRRAYQDQTYWARPVPGFGDPRARVLILGLAPGAHGANRTGRPFTGDGSGYFMYPVLHETGFANQPEAISRDDGLRLRNAWIASVVRCAPPGDKPTPQEIRNCSVHLTAEIGQLDAVPRCRLPGKDCL